LPGTSMSGGQQQMLAISRALMARPRLVIFDEISLGLAPVVMDKLYEMLALLKEARVTLIVIEQDVDRALALVDRAYVMEHGAFGLSGKAAEIAANPLLRHIYVGSAD
jgi:branched-chain amino acid transport system ATP-binding protein